MPSWIEPPVNNKAKETSGKTGEIEEPKPDEKPKDTRKTIVVSGMKFELLDKEARLVRCDKTRPWARIPKEVEGLPVTRIGG